MTPPMRGHCSSPMALAMGFALAVSFGAAPVQAGTLVEIKADGILKVGLTGDYAPYALRRPGGGTVGADIAMAVRLAQALGVGLEIVPTTWKAMSNDFEANRFDIAMGGVSITTERSALGLFSLPVMHDGKRPIVRCADKDRYTSIAAIDRRNVRVEVNPGGTNQVFDNAHFPHAQLNQRRDNTGIFDDLASDRADVMVTDGAEVDFQARHHRDVLCAAEVTRAFDHFDKAYWMTRDPALKTAVDAVVRKNLENGAYRRFLTW